MISIPINKSQSVNFTPYTTILFAATLFGMIISTQYVLHSIIPPAVEVFVLPIGTKFNWSTTFCDIHVLVAPVSHTAFHLFDGNESPILYFDNTYTSVQRRFKIPVLVHVKAL